ncbi:MAG TPA: MFS transporter [Bacillales bacterium]
MQQISRSASRKFTSVYYGWVIVALAGLGVFFSGPGQTYSVSVFINSYIQDFGWSRSLVSGIYSFATLAAGLLLFIIGRLVDRFGQRVMMAGVGLMLAVACFWNSVVIGPIMLFIGFFMLRLFGQGSMTLVPNTLVPQWFIQKRGRALSVMTIGAFASSAALPPFNAWMIHTWGWPVAWRVWGIILIIVFVPLVLLFVRNRPEDVGLLPDNVSNPIRMHRQMEQKKLIYMKTIGL